MATTREDIRNWLATYNDGSNSHMLVVCDTFDYEDYPVPVRNGENVQAAFDQHSRNMERVMEVYSYSLPLEAQLNERRAFHF